MHQRRHVAAIVILKDLLRHGKFIQDVRFGALYYFDEQGREVYPLSFDGKEIDPLFDAFLCTEYSLFGKQTDIFIHILRYAVLNNEQREVQRLYYYDSKQKVLFVYNGSEYFRLDGESIITEPNGKEVLFQKEKLFDPIEYIPQINRPKSINLLGVLFPVEDILLDTVINRTNFIDCAALSKKQQCLQSAIQLHIFPFVSSLKTKGITTVVGDQGSGKSFFLRTIGMLLTSSLYYQVSALPEKKDDFIVSLVNNPFAFFDNIEDKPKWFEDILCATATGVRLPKRKLYSTWDEAAVVPKCFVGLTSIDPKYRRNDLVDRLLLFFIARFEEYYEEDDLLMPFEEHMGLLRSIYLDNLNRIVLTLQSKSKIIKKTKHRLADWAPPGLIGPVVSIEEGPKVFELIRTEPDRVRKYAVHF